MCLLIASFKNVSLTKWKWSEEEVDVICNTFNFLSFVSGLQSLSGFRFGYGEQKRSGFYSVFFSSSGCETQGLLGCFCYQLLLSGKRLCENWTLQTIKYLSYLKAIQKMTQDQDQPVVLFEGDFKGLSYL